MTIARPPIATHAPLLADWQWVVVDRAAPAPRVLLLLERPARLEFQLPVKKRVSFLIEPDVLERLRTMKARTGVSESEQIRQGIQMWLDSREWPVRRGVDPPLREE